MVETVTPEPRLPDPVFWRGRRVLVTGHTGFKGTWLCAWLDELGATVAGVSLPEAPSDPSLWDQVGLPLADDVRADIRSRDWQDRAEAFGPEFVLHLAAQPLVSAGWSSPAETFDINVMGTARLMELLPRLTTALATLVVTTDKVYKPRGAVYDEDSPLGGEDPYSASKACAELVVHSWPQPGHPVATARAGNVIGGGDWAENRLLPDLVRSWSCGQAAVLRRPDSVRPWQHVLEPICGYLLYLEDLASGHTVPSALNFGPPAQQSVCVRDVAQHGAREWARINGGTVPPVTALDAPTMHETRELSIDSTLAAETLGWAGRLDWKQSVTLTLEWFAVLSRGDASAAELLREQIAAYTKAAG